METEWNFEKCVVRSRQEVLKIFNVQCINYLPKKKMTKFRLEEWYILLENKLRTASYQIKLIRLSIVLKLYF